MTSIVYPYCWHSHAWHLRPHITGVAVVPIRVPTPITTSTRSSIHFIELPKKKPLMGELIRPSSHGEDGGYSSLELKGGSR